MPCATVTKTSVRDAASYATDVHGNANFAIVVSVPSAT
jgi:hypothetical protein